MWKNKSRTLLVPIAGATGAVLTILLFSITDWDVRLQNRLFLNGPHRWLWDRHEPVTKFLLYDGFKAGLFVIALVLVLRLVVEGRRSGYWLRHNLATAALLVMVLTPLSVSVLKALTNVPCPRDIVAYGGSLPRVTVLQAWPEGERPERRQRCFPAGHASGAFGLLGLMILVDRRRTKVIIALVTLVLGWLTGGYKMVIGDHFFSHTAVSMWIAVFWCGCINRFWVR